MSANSWQALADNEVDWNSRDVVLDAYDIAGPGESVKLQFGNILAETLEFDIDNDYFILSDSLVVDGNVNIYGSTLRLDWDETGNPDQDLEIIAEQGSESNGALRYDDGNNRWELSNAGGAFAEIATVGTPVPLATAQMRETGGYIISNGSFANVDFDVVDEESNSAEIDADETSDDFTVLADGYYLISYDFTLQNDVIAAVDGQVLLNGTTVLNGSEGSTGTHTAITTGNELSQSFVTQLSTNDTITMQTQTATAGNDMLADGVFVIVRLEGEKGAKGDQGDPGTTSTLDQAYDEGGPGAGRAITADSGAVDIDGDGLEVDNLDFNGNTISTLDVDGDLILSPNGTGIINFAAIVDIGGATMTLDADEVGDPDQDIDIVANQGTEADGTLRYDDGNNRWEISNNGGTFNPLHLANVLSAYDSTGNDDVDGTQSVLNIDTSRVVDSAYSLAADVVTINQDGLYKITAILTVDSFDTSGTQRSNIELKAQLDPTGGAATFSDIPGALCMDYMREQNLGISSASCTISLIDTFSNGDRIQLTHLMTGTSTGQTLPEASSLTIELIR